ncbi:MAG TPA: hypothetical protein VES97_01210, partial [Solirubrobacteraceae bacterium]|nr:hypothetical protein [Solirubrobacteraceae bacterium]
MRLHVRISILTLAATALIAASAPAAAQAAFGVEKFFAANCNAAHEACKQAAEPSKEKEQAEVEGFPQAGGHPNFGITDFTVSNIEIGGQKIPFNGAELAKVRHIRTDVAPGVSTNPQAVPKCSAHDFGVELGGGIFQAPTCPASTEIGINKVVVVGPKGGGTDQPLEGKVYNLEQTPGLSSLYGVAVEFPKAFAEEIFKGTPFEAASKAIPLFAHTLIEGGVEYASDYHDFFEIKVSETLPLLSSRLIFKGNIGGPGLGGKGAFFLTNPTSCTGIGPQTTNKVTIEDSKGETGEKTYETPIGGSGCASIPFAPTFSLTPETAASDQPDGVTIRVATTHPEPIDSSDLKTAVVRMPEGMTMNPSAASGLEGCTPAQIGIGTRAETKCPPGSRIGTVALEVPGLPPESLKGYVYLGKPASGSITAPPYTIYFDAESAKYNIKTRLKGTVEPSLTTGQVTTKFEENPEQPFTEAIVHFNGGAFAPIANPLVCGTGTSTAAFTPYSGFNTPSPSELPFTTEGCTSSFAPVQTTSTLPTAGGSDSNFTFNLTRPEGQQYLEKVTTVLPPGLVGKIPTVPLCTEAQAKATEAQSGEECPAASLVGSVRVTAGSGEPFPFPGSVYLTGPTAGAPYGLLFKVPVVAGPFNLGTEVRRATINVDPHTARVIVATTLPTIRAGIPTRLRSLSVEINRANYILNPTNCQLEAVESVVTSTLGNTVLASSPFQAEGCSSLAFKPSFSATSSGHTSKANGASLETTINQPSGQANMKSVFVTLPKQLPSRLTTLQKACPEATFAANPYTCPAGSLVGGARANTPVLPAKMSGPAFLVSHAGAAFPDLDLVLEANGVRVIVVGNTDIKNGITTTNFATTPDVPVSSVTVNLPVGPHSALGANGDLCTSPLFMPTTITGQNGVQVKQNTKIAVTGCGVRVVGAKVIGNIAYLTVRTFAAGRISGSGSGLGTVFRTLGAATKAATLKVPLSAFGRSRPRPFKTR